MKISNHWKSWRRIFPIIGSWLSCAAVTLGGGARGQGCKTDPEHLRNADLKAPHSAESEHFRIVWGRGLSAKFSAEQAKGTLRNFEMCRALFVNELGMKPPEERDGKRYRVTVATMNGGYESGGGAVNIDPSGLRVDPPSWIIPHELMHVFQEVQGGKMCGDWCESHANYANELMLIHDPKNFSGESAFEPAFTTMAHWYLANGRDYYLCWPVWCYLDENPDKLSGLGAKFSTKMWQQAREDEDFFHLVKRLAPDVDIQDLIGLYARRAATWDYLNGAAMRKKFDGFLADETVLRLVYPELIARPDDPAWLRVPPEMAPQQGGYTIHRLTPVAREVTVVFRGLSDRRRGADWRASLVVRKRDGAARYGRMWNSGAASITLEPDETNLFLVVAATPTSFVFGNQDEVRFPWNSHPQRQRFPYEIKLTGARAGVAGRSSHSDAGHRHPNGGGFVADGAKVSALAFVGSNAMVLGEAQVFDGARVEDFAVVKDRATLRDRAVASGHAMILDNAVVCDDAHVRDWAVVRDEAVVSGAARILQRASIREKARVKDFATIEGGADVWAEASAFVGGDAVLSADYGGGRKVTNGFQFGFVPYEACPKDWIVARTAPARRFASYDFDGPHDSLAKDAPGITDGILIGSPVWRDTDGDCNGFLEFDGKSQAILLERSFGDFRSATFCAWVKWRGRPLRQPIFYFGTGPENFLSVVLNGSAAILARRDGKDYSFVATQPLPHDRWTHIAAAFDGTNATLMINGATSIRGLFAARPENFLAAGGAQYFGRDDSARFFSGSADEIRAFSEALSAERVKRDAMPMRAVVKK